MPPLALLGNFSIEGSGGVQSSDFIVPTSSTSKSGREDWSVPLGQLTPSEELIYWSTRRRGWSKLELEGTFPWTGG
jgi:hypothetical protein